MKGLMLYDPSYGKLYESYQGFISVAVWGDYKVDLSLPERLFRARKTSTNSP